MRLMMDVLRALADESRVRTVMALRGRELCVCQIVELLQLAPSTVSKHMAILRQARLVESRKEGRWMHYRLAENDATDEARSAIAWITRALASDARIRADVRRLAAIVKRNREELCRVQAGR